MKTFKLNSGHEMPALGFGTWKVPEDAVADLLEEAIDAGYRHVDCAAGYGNEAAVGAGLKKVFDKGNVKREEIFVTSKLWHSKHKAADVRSAVQQSLSDLKLDYLDLFLIHWPVVLRDGHKLPAELEDFIPLDKVPTSETWAEMEKLVDEGLIKSIGLSNYSPKKLDELLAVCRIPPAVNQVECHPYLQQADVHRYCEAKNIHVTGYSPIGSPDRPARVSKEKDEPLLLEDKTVNAIATKHKVSPAQVLLHWGVVVAGHSVLCKSSNRQRLEANLASITALTMDDDDKKQLAALEKNRRYITGSFWCIEGSPYTMDNLWDEAASVDNLLAKKTTAGAKRPNNTDESDKSNGSNKKAASD